MSADKNTTETWNELEGYAGMVAAEILEETEDEDERHDAIHEAADGSHYVIYTAEAWDVVHAARHRHHAIHDEATQQLTDMAGDKIGRTRTSTTSSRAWPSASWRCSSTGNWPRSWKRKTRTAKTNSRSKAGAASAAPVLFES